MSKLSEKSKAFKFIDIEEGGAVFFIQANTGFRFSRPDYYIRGAITQVDRNVASDSTGFSVGLPWAALGYSQDQFLSLVTMDMNIGSTTEFYIIPGLHTTNTITTVRSGRGGDAEGIIEKASLYFEVAQDRSQGTHQAVRTLIELSLIEVLGKLTKVPYWRCLGLETTNPKLIAQSRDWYDSLDTTEQVKTIQSALISTGDYSGLIHGLESKEFAQSVQRYQARNDLIADGRVDFDLYYRLLADNEAVVPSKDQFNKEFKVENLQAVSPDAPTSKNEPAGHDPIGLKLEPFRETSNGYRAGDKLTFEISVNKAAFVHCYYEFHDEHGYQVVRVFPNEWDSEPIVTPNYPIHLPSSRSGFDLVADSIGEEEQIACIAMDENSRLTGTARRIYNEGELVPLTNIEHVFSVVNAYQDSDRYNTSVKTVGWVVY